jgi:hypothetical protein
VAQRARVANTVSALNWEKNKRNQERSQRVREDRPRARISVKGQQPPTDKQLSYLRDLARQLDRDMPTPAHRQDAGNLITQFLQQLAVKGGGRNPNSPT